MSTFAVGIYVSALGLKESVQQYCGNYQASVRYIELDLGCRLADKGSVGPARYQQSSRGFELCYILRLGPHKQD